MEEEELRKQASFIVEQSMQKLLQLKTALEVERLSQERALLQRIEIRRLERRQRGRRTPGDVSSGSAT